MDKEIHHNISVYSCLFLDIFAPFMISVETLMVLMTFW